MRTRPDRPWRSRLLWLPALIFLGLFFLWPMAAVFREGVAGAARSGGFGYDPAELLRVTGFTLGQAALSTVLTFLVGLPGAYLFARYDFTGKRLLRALTFIPFVLPTVVAAAGFQALLGPGGLLPNALGAAGIPAPVDWIPSFGALLLGHVFYNTSIVLRVVGDAWARLDPRLIAAARTLGAGRGQAFHRVTLPLLAPSMLTAAALVFLFDFTSFGVVLMLAGPRFATLEVEIFFQAMRMLNLPAAALLSGAQALCTLALAALSSGLGRRNEDAFHSRPSMPAARAPHGWIERASIAAVVGFLSLFLLAPLAAPVIRSVIPAGGGAPTLAYYRELFVNRRGSAFYVSPLQAAGQSLLVASLAAGLALVLGIPASAALARPGRMERWMEPLLLMPLGFSSVTLGLGMLLVFSRPPFDFIRSPFLLPAAHAVVALPFVVRTLRPAFAGIPQRWRDAARALGASPLRAWLAVDLPVAARAVVSAAGFAFVISLGEFGATSFMVRPEAATLPMAVYRFLSLPGALNYGQAMASASLLMLLCGAAVWLMEFGRADR